MCLRVDTNGCGPGKNTHVSVFVTLMQGEYDSSLKWPFRGDITVQLLNQLEDKGHHERTFSFSDITSDDDAGPVIGKEKAAYGLGLSQFIPHSELNYNCSKNCQYLKNDCLHFRVHVDGIGPYPG